MVALLGCAVPAPGRGAIAGVPAADDAGATDSAVSVTESFIAEGPDLFTVVCVMFSWPGHPQDHVGCVAHLGYVAQVLRNGHVDLCTPNQPMCHVEFKERPTTTRYGPGKVANVGPYRCEVLKVAVRCLVRSTGSGFRINNHEAVRIGTAPPKKIAAPKPVFARTAMLETVSGTVLVKAPGAAAFVPLGTLTSVPLGTTVDTTAGTVQLTAAADRRGHVQTGRFYEGVFRLTQTTASSRLQGGRKVGITVLTLAGAPPSGCGATLSRATMATNHTTRRLWGNAHGNFRTEGRYASATVRGTKWLTEDTCGGTVIKVARGIVSVTDLRTHKTVLVHAGGSFRVSSSPATATSARLWTALAGKVECGPTGNAPGLQELLCFSKSVPAPPPTPGCVGRPEAPECNVGDPGFAYLHPTGNPGLARPSQLLWYPNARPMALSSGQTWSNRTLGITCSIGATAVRCVNTSGHGFTITNSSYSAF
jgi:hypothetical protein